MTPRVYLVRVNSPIAEKDFIYLKDFVQPEKKERILRQGIKQNADNILLGEILAKASIKEVFGVDIKKQSFAYTEKGKPYLLDYPDIHFNISHSGDLVVCCVSDKPVGIDIQRIGKYNEDVAKRVCNEDELRFILNSSDRESEFTRLWTRKEAVIKKLGIGIANADIKNCTTNQNIYSAKFDDYWFSVTE